MTTPPSFPGPVAAPRKTWRAGMLTYTAGGLVILFAWLLWGDFAWSMKERTVGPVLPLLLKKFDASDTLTGVLIGFLPGLIGMIVSPIVSYRSDHFRSRWGRRIPFLLFSTPFAAVAMLGVAFSPALGAPLDRVLGSHSPGVNNVSLFLIGTFWTLFEVFTFVANSVFGALVKDVVPDPLLGRFYGAFRALSLIAGMIFNLWLFGKAETLYVWIFLGIGLLYGVGFMSMCFNVREGEYPPPPPRNPNHGAIAFLAAARVYAKDCFTHAYYWWFYVASALAAMSFLPTGWYMTYYAKSLHMDLAVMGQVNFYTFGASLLLAYPLGMLVDWFHPLRLCIAVMAVLCVTTLSAGFFVHDTVTFSIVLAIYTFISGVWWTVSASLGLRLLPRANFAQLSSAGGIVGSLGGIALAPLVGMFLDHVHHVYRYTYFMSAGLSAAAFLVMLGLHARFMRLGGPTNYVAPVNETAP